MKRVLLLLLLITGIMYCYHVEAATPDTTPPVINEWSIEGNTFKLGDTFSIYFDAEDDVSGVAMFGFEFVNTNGKDRLMVSPSVHYGGKGTYLYSVPLTAKPGIYDLYIVEASDEASNSVCKITPEFKKKYPDENSCIEGAVDFRLTITEADDIQKPVVSNLMINKTVFEVGEIVEIKAEITDVGSNGIVTVMYDNVPNIKITLNREGDTDTFKGSLTLKRAGKFKLNNLSVYDGDKTTWQFVYPDFNGYSNNMIFTIPSGLLDIEVNGDVDDVFPELVSVKIDKKIITTPGTNKVTVIVTDNVGISEVQVDFAKKGSNNNLHFSQYDTKKVGDGKYEVSLAVNQYAEAAEYYIKGIIIRDTSGNMTIYYAFNAEQHGYEELDYYSFKVEKSLAAEEITTTENDQALKKVNEASENAIIAIDSTRNSLVKKELFDAIKGTNKTMYISSNGIQWIFYGQNIVNTTKDINVHVDIITNENPESGVYDLLNDNSLIVKFHPNGLLPGIAKVRIKAEYTFRNYIGHQDLYVYYYDETNGVLDPVVQKLNMTTDGYYEFFINHNSTYVLTSSQPDIKFISKKSNLIEINNRTDQYPDYNNLDPDELIAVIDAEESLEDYENEKIDIQDNPHDAESVNNNKDVVHEKEGNILFYFLTHFFVIIILTIGFIVYKKKLNIEKINNFLKKKNN